MSELENNLPLADQNQLALASRLSIDSSEWHTLEQLIWAIDAKLNGDKLEERARWYGLSVLCYVRKEKWKTVEDIALPEIEQYALANHCLAIEGFAKSLTTILRDPRCAYTLVTFHKSKNLANRVLPRASKAFRIVLGVLNKSTLLDVPVAQPVVKKSPPSRKKVAPKFDVSAGIHRPKLKRRRALMSDAEFAEFERLLEPSFT